MAESVRHHQAINKLHKLRQKHNMTMDENVQVIRKRQNAKCNAGNKGGVSRLYQRGRLQKSHPRPSAGQTPIFSLHSLQEHKSEACDEEPLVEVLRMTEGNQSSAPGDKLFPRLSKVKLNRFLQHNGHKTEQR